MQKQLTRCNYTSSGNGYQLLLPLNLEIRIPKDDPVRLLSQKLEELNYTQLYKAYSHRGRKPAVSPKVLFKIMVYAYMNGIYTSRSIETACRRDINFMWLMEGRRAPDHNTIARFRSERLSDVVEDLFSQLVVSLFHMGEVAFENLFIDGTKIEANANKYTFVWKGAIVKNKSKTLAKLSDTIERINRVHGLTFPLDSPLEPIYQSLIEIKKKEGIEFVYGKGQRKTVLQRDVETIERIMEQLSKYDECLKRFEGRKSFSKTDNDATFMRMKDDHMRNSQLKPGYNVQVAVEGEFIVGMAVSSERSDHLTLIPFLKQLEENFEGRLHRNIVADAGYESEENYMYLQQTKQGCYIKPANYEKSKTRKYKNDMYLRENMPYDTIKDEYCCPNGKIIKSIGKTTRKSKSGHVSEITIYECESCEGCSLKSKCTKAVGNRQLSISKKFIRLRGEALANISSKQGILLRMNRSIQAEGAFGVLKYDYGFQRFLTRGKVKVHTEILLLGLGYNINKLHNKIQSNRCGILLHKSEIAA